VFLRVDANCRKLFRDELGAEPSEQTASVFSRPHLRRHTRDDDRLLRRRPNRAEDGRDGAGERTALMCRLPIAATATHNPPRRILPMRAPATLGGTGRQSSSGQFAATASTTLTADAVTPCSVHRMPAARSRVFKRCSIRRQESLKAGVKKALRPASSVGMLPLADVASL